jgi:hypothetical protein
MAQFRRIDNAGQAETEGIEGPLGLGEHDFVLARAEVGSLVSEMARTCWFKVPTRPSPHHELRVAGVLGRIQVKKNSNLTYEV